MMMFRSILFRLQGLKAIKHASSKDGYLNNFISLGEEMMQDLNSFNQKIDEMLSFVPSVLAAKDDPQAGEVLAQHYIPRIANLLREAYVPDFDASRAKKMIEDRKEEEVFSAVNEKLPKLKVAVESMAAVCPPWKADVLYARSLFMVYYFSVSKYFREIQDLQRAEYYALFVTEMKESLVRIKAKCQAACDAKYDASTKSIEERLVLLQATLSAIKEERKTIDDERVYFRGKYGINPAFEDAYESLSVRFLSQWVIYE